MLLRVLKQAGRNMIDLIGGERQDSLRGETF